MLDYSLCQPLPIELWNGRGRSKEITGAKALYSVERNPSMSFESSSLAKDE